MNTPFELMRLFLEDAVEITTITELPTRQHPLERFSLRAGLVFRFSASVEDMRCTRIFSMLWQPAAAKLLDCPLVSVARHAHRFHWSCARESLRAIEFGFFQIPIRNVGFYRNPIAAA